MKILIKASNISQFDQEEQLQMAQMVITNILGEEDVIDYVDVIEVVTDFPQKYQAYREPLVELNEHIDEILDDY